MFNEQVNKSFENYEQKKKRGKKLFLLYSASAFAATLTILLIIFNPFKSTETANYIAMAETPFEVSIDKMRSIRSPSIMKDSLSIFENCEKLKIAAVPDIRLENRYFFDGCTLYTYFKDADSVKILSDFDKDLNKIYYLEKDGQNYKFSTTANIVNQKIYELVKVEN